VKTPTQSVIDVTVLLNQLNPSFELLKISGNTIERPQLPYGELRALFIRALADLGIQTEVSAEIKEVLEQSQFRSLDTGRGPAVVALLGKSVAEKMQAKADEIGTSYFHNGYSTATPDRGVDQALADLLASAVCDLEAGEAAWKRLQRRIWKGYVRLFTYKKSQFPQDMIGIVNAKFSDLEPPSSLLASCPAGGAPGIWGALVSSMLEDGE
jgi:hypothetical protein